MQLRFGGLVGFALLVANFGHCPPGCAAAPPPAIETAPPKYAQHLVNVALAAHLNVDTLIIYATPPHAKNTVIVASNIGRIGKPANADVLHVIASGESKSEVNAAGTRFDVEEPLQDVSGLTIGAIDVAFPNAKGEDTKPSEHAAADIGAYFSRHVLSDVNLDDHYPYSADFSPDNAAQALVDKTMARHPELLVLGMHVTLPDERGNVFLGSNIGRIGKKADADDMRVVTTGKSNFEISENGKRYEVELVLRNAAGQNIGALGTVFRYTSPSDKPSLNARAIQIRDELARNIPSSAALLAKGQ